MNLTEEDIANIQSAVDYIRELAMNHANPYDPTMEEWGAVFDATDEICSVLEDISNE